MGGKSASVLLIVSTTTVAGLDTQAKRSSALLVLLQPALLASLDTAEGESTVKAFVKSLPTHELSTSATEGEIIA